jgi:autotransporter-associated beta strand protein
MNDGAGQLGLHLTGTGTLTLAGVNGYSGGTTINAGTLRLAAPAALPLGGNVTVNNGGLLDLSGQPATVGSLSGAGTVDNTAAASVMLTVGYNNSSSTFSGVLQNTGGSMSVTKVGSGNFTLGAANNYSGTTNVQSGVLSLGAIGAVTGPVSVTGGTLDASALPQSIYSVSIGSFGSLNLAASNLITSTGNDAFGGTLNILGFTSGTAELMSYTGHTGTFTTVTGLTPAYQLLYSANQLDIISAGPPTWAVATSGSWTDGSKWTSNVAPSGSGQTAIVGAATSTPVTITLDNPQTLGTLEFTNSSSNAAGYTLASGSAGSLTLENTGSSSLITVTGGSHGISAPLFISNNTLEVSASSSGILTISGSVSDFGAGASLKFDGDGTGELVISGTNNFGGPTATATVSAGTLVLNNSEALADGTNLTIGDALAFSGIQAASSTEAAAPSLAISPVPEPGTLALFGAGAVMLAVFRKRRKI